MPPSLLQTWAQTNPCHCKCAVENKGWRQERNRIAHHVTLTWRHFLSHGSGSPEVLVHTWALLDSQLNLIGTSKTGKSKGDVSAEEARRMQNGNESAFLVLKIDHKAKLQALKPGKYRERSISLGLSVR